MVALDKRMSMSYELCTARDAISFTVHLQGESGGWVGLGVSPDTTMNFGGMGSDVIVCEGGGVVRRYKVFSHGTPSGGVEVEGARCEQDVNGTTMHFERSVGVEPGSGELALSIEPGIQTVFIWAYNAAAQNFAYHGVNRGNTPVELASGIVGKTLRKSAPNTLWAHAMMMLAAWGVVLPLGVLASRHRGAAGEGRWYILHRNLQTFGWALQIAAFVCAVAYTDDEGEPHFRSMLNAASSWHKGLGLASTPAFLLPTNPPD